MSDRAPNLARPISGARLVPFATLPDPGALAVDFSVEEQRFSLILVRRGALVRGFENRCPHARLPMDRPDGRVAIEDGRFLICAMHGASFDLENGACVGGPATRGLTAFPVGVDDDWVVIL